MIRLLLDLILICIPTLYCFGQNVNEKVEEESVNLKALVRYIPIDSISIVRPRQKVKLDFKTKEENIEPYPLAYPSLRGARLVLNDIHWYGDSVNLKIDGQNIKFIERKGKTVDYYLFMVECLISNSYKLGRSLLCFISNPIDYGKMGRQFYKRLIIIYLSLKICKFNNEKLIKPKALPATGMVGMAFVKKTVQSTVALAKLRTARHVALKLIQNINC